MQFGKTFLWDTSMRYVSLKHFYASAAAGALFTSLLVGLLTAGSVLADEVASSRPSTDSHEIKTKGNSLRGHLKHLGAHRPAEGFITTVDGFLDPETFYREHVLASKPVLFRGAARQLPAFQLWSDTYLNEKYGTVTVEVERGKKEDRSGNFMHIPLSEFLQTYKDQDIYMVQDLVPEMTGDFILPKSLQCGGFQNVLTLSVIWFSSGGTKSVLHNDDVDNINCILDGGKSLVMIDKAYQPYVEDESYVRDKSYSLVDVERVDLRKFPMLADIPWWEAKMEKGDCLYIPIRWYHTVASSGSRNLAVNLWFSHLAWFNKSDCAACCKENPSLSKYKIGQSLEQIRHDMFGIFETYENIRMEDAVDAWSDLLTPALVQELFEIVDADKDMSLTWEEVFSADMSRLAREFPEILGEDTKEDLLHDEL